VRCTRRGHPGRCRPTAGLDGRRSRRERAGCSG
jgi:hypothetical protein